MYQFRHLDTYYDIEVSLEYPDYRHTFYNSREHLIARYDKNKDQYTFTLEGRENILINKESAVEVMDNLMIEVGNLLYPIELNVDTKGEILGVKNFDEIKKRWFSNAQKILDNNRTHHFKRYLQISSRNLKAEEKLKEALMRNSLIKLVIKPINLRGFMFSINDFPSKGGITMFNCVRHRGRKETGIVTEYKANLVLPNESEGDGYIKYRFSELNDILEVEARFDITDESGQKWVKRITIKADKDERSASHKDSLWKRMLD